MPSHRVSSDYNVFGYDPQGFIAHLAALFYGPGWRPRVLGPRPFYVGAIQPPRYGPPALHQRPCLPENFTPCPPPHYYGTPNPPYLPAPTGYYPDFPGVLKGLQVSISQDRMKVYPVNVAYLSGSVKRIFEILTNITWAKFHSEICGRLGVDPGQSHLEYRIFSAGLYSDYSPLDMELEWSLAMRSISWGCQRGHEVEIQILKLRKPGRYALTSCLNHGLALSLNAPRIKTYAFTYPTLSDLFDHLNVRDCLLKLYQNMDDVWYSDMLDVLEGIPMVFIDELTFISPRALHLLTGMPAWRIDSLYKEAMEMIKHFHREMYLDIEDIEGMRKVVCG